MGATSPAWPQQPVADDPRWPPCLLGTSCVVQCLLQTPSGSGYRQSRTENIRLLFFPHPALLPHPPSPESSPHRRSPSQALFLGRLASDKRLLRQSLCQWPLRVAHHPPGQPVFRPGRGRGRWKANGPARPLPCVSAKGPSADCSTAGSCDVLVVKRSRGSLVYRLWGWLDAQIGPP